MKLRESLVGLRVVVGWLMILASTGLALAQTKDVVFVAESNGQGGGTRTQQNPITVWETGMTNAPVPANSTNFFSVNHVLGENAPLLVARTGITGGCPNPTDVTVFGINQVLSKQFLVLCYDGSAGTAGSWTKLGEGMTSDDPLEIQATADATRAYIGVGRQLAGTSFDSIEEWDTSNPKNPTFLKKYSLGIDFIQTMAVNPQGTHIVGYGYQANQLVDLNLSTRTLTIIPTGVKTPFGGIRFEPTGCLAYFSLGINPNVDSVPTEIATYSVCTSPGTISGIPFPSLPPGSYFAPVSPTFVNGRVYFMASGYGSDSLFVLDTPSIAPTNPHFVNVGRTYVGYALEAGIDPMKPMLYMNYAFNADYFGVFPLDSVTGDVIAKDVQQFVVSPDRSGPYTITVATQNPVKVNFKAIPAPDTLLSAAGRPDVNADSLYLPAGSTPTAVVNPSQPSTLLLTGPKYDFVGWQRDSNLVSATSKTCADKAPYFESGSTVTASALVDGVEDTYYACFNTSYYRTVVVTGSCTVTPGSDWQLDQTTVQLTVTPASGWVASGPTQVLINGGPVTANVTCTQVSSGTVTVTTNIPFTKTLPSIIVTAPGKSGSAPQFPTATGTLTVSSLPVQVLDAGNPGVQYNLSSWNLNGPPTSTFVYPPPTSAGTQIVNVPITGGTYIANYDTYFIVTVVNNGCDAVNLKTGFYKANSTPVIDVTAPAGGLISDINQWYGIGSVAIPLANHTSIPGILGPGSTITATCKAVPPNCVAPPKISNLLTWYTLDETASPATNRGGGSANPATWVNNPAPLAAGKVQGALTFNGSNYAEATTAAEGDIGTGNFSVDLWIRTTAFAGVQAFLDKRVLSPSVQGYVFYLSDGRLAFQLADGGSGSTFCDSTADSSCTNWGSATTSPNVADGQWHLVAATIDRSSAIGGKLWVDGAVILTFDPRVRPGSLSNSAKLRIGNHVSGGQFNGSLDEIEIFNTVLEPSDITALYNAGGGGKCHVPVPSITARVIVNTNQPGKQMVVGVDNQPVQPLKIEPWGPNAVVAGPQTITAPVQKLDLGNSNIRYDFREWFFNSLLMNSPAPPHKAVAQPVTVLPAGGTYTAQYDTFDYIIVVNNGCAATSFSTSWYKDGIPPRAVATPGTGKAFNSIIVSFPGSPDSAPYSNNEDLGSLLPGSTVTFKCSDDVIRVNVNTNLASVGGTPSNAIVGINPPGVWSGTLSTSYTSTTVPNGQAIVVRSGPSDIVSGDTRWQFQNWSRNSSLIAGTSNASNVSAGVATYAAVAVGVTGGDTFTANYQQQYKLNVNVIGTCTVNPLTGFYPVNASLPITVTPANTGHSATLATAGGTPFPIPLNQPLSVGAPGLTFTVTCASTDVTVTLETSPANLGALVSLGLATSGLPLSNTGTNSVSLITPPTGTLTLSAPATVIFGGAYYQLQNYTIKGGSTGVGSTLPVPATSTTYVANYLATGYILTLGGSAGCIVTVTSSSLAAIQTSPLVYPTGALVNITGSAPAGQVFQSMVIGKSGVSLTINGTTGQAFMDKATTITPTCGAPATVNVTVNTQPGSIGSTVAIASASTNYGSGLNTFTAGVTPGTVTMSATYTIVTPTIGYRLKNWLIPGGALVPTGTSTSYVATIGATPANVTYTAVYEDHCYVLAITASPLTGGTVTASPATGGLPGYPANCYAPGTTVTLTANPASGNALKSWTGTVTGTGNSTTVVMSQPRTVTATFDVIVGIKLTVATNPTGLDARIGGSGAFAAAPVSATNVLASSSAAIEVTAQILKNGTGYQFTNWTGGTFADSTKASTTVGLGTADLAVTANFVTLCYVVTANVAPSGGGTVSITTPNAANDFGNNCFRPGSDVVLFAMPSAGNAFSNWTGGASGTNPSSVITVSGPTTVTANFGPPPVISVVATSRTANTGNLGVNILNAGGPANNLRITAIASATAGISWDNGRTLPSNIGLLPNGGNYGLNLGFKSATGLITAPFKFTITVAGDNVAPTTFTVTTP